jgi:hypothetical protein
MSLRVRASRTTGLETAVQAHLDQLEREAIHAETEAFLDMHDELVGKYEGEHVALCRGEVVDHGEAPSRLERRVREQFGELPVLIAPVKSKPRQERLGVHFEDSVGVRVWKPKR